MFGPTKFTLVDWKMDEDLRKIGKRARLLTRGVKANEGVLVTNTAFGTKREKFRLLVKDKDGHVWVLTPPGGNPLLSLFVKVHEFTDSLWDKAAA